MLAAGLSSRMKCNKLLLKIGEKTVLQKVLEKIKEAGLEKITVVVGNDKEAVMENIAGHQIRILENEDFAQGMSTSLLTAIHMAMREKKTNGILVLMGDMPFIQAATIKEIVAAYKTAHGILTAPRYEGRPGHPVLIDNSLFPELLHISGDEGARFLLDKYRQEIVWHDVCDPGIRIDIDNYTDYQRCIQWK